MRIAPAITITEEQALQIQAWARGRSVEVLLAQRAQMILLAAAQRGLPCMEYRPVEVKMAVTGYGGAEKRQVQQMVKQLLSLPTIPKPDDAADALAIWVGKILGDRLPEKTIKIGASIAFFGFAAWLLLSAF